MTFFDLLCSQKIWYMISDSDFQLSLAFTTPHSRSPADPVVQPGSPPQLTAAEYR